MRAMPSKYQCSEGDGPLQEAHRICRIGAEICVAGSNIEIATETIQVGSSLGMKGTWPLQIGFERRSISVIVAGFSNMLDPVPAFLLKRLQRGDKIGLVLPGLNYASYRYPTEFAGLSEDPSPDQLVISANLKEIHQTS